MGNIGSKYLYGIICGPDEEENFVPGGIVKPLRSNSFFYGSPKAKFTATWPRLFISSADSFVSRADSVKKMSVRASCLNLTWRSNSFRRVRLAVVEEKRITLLFYGYLVSFPPAVLVGRKRQNKKVHLLKQNPFRREIRRQNCRSNFPIPRG